MKLIFGMPILHKNGFMAFLVVVMDMKSGQLMLTCYEVNIWYVDPTQKWIYGIPCCCSGYEVRQLMLTCYEANIFYADPTQKWIYGIPCCCSGYEVRATDAYML